MPVVRYGQRKVTTDPLAGVRKQSAETFESEGGGLARAQGETADQLGRLANTVAALSTQQVAEMQRKERDRADQVALLDAETQLGKWENKRLYDPQSGAFQVKGKDAMPLPEEVGGEFDTVASALESTLNPRQREQFAPVKARRSQNLDANLRRHVFGEMQTYEAQTVAAAEENASESAVANALDPRRVGEELKRGVDAIKQSAPRLGMSPDVLEKHVNDFTTKTHVGVIGRLLTNNQTRAAKIYFEETKGEITGSALGQVEKAIEVGGQRAEAQKATDEILAAGGSLKEQRTKAKAIEDPEVRDQVTQRLEHEAAVSERESREQEEATLLNAYNIVDRSHDVTSIPPGAWANLPGNARSALRGYATSLAKGVPIETDQQVYYMLREAATTDPDAFLNKTNLLTFKDKLSDSDFQELTRLRGDLRSAKKPPMLDDWRKEHEVIASALTLAGLDPAPKDSDTEGKRRVAQFSALVSAEARRLQGTSQAKITNKDLEAIANGILAKQITDKGWFYDSTRSLATATVDDIPKAEKAEILARLAAKGYAATPEAALAIWLQSKASGVK